MSAALELRDEGDTLLFVLSGRLDAESTGRLWTEAFEGLDRKKPRRAAVDASAVDYCDGSGIGLLVELRRRQGQEIEVRGLAPQFKSLLDLFPFDTKEAPAPERRRLSVTVEIGRGTSHILSDLRKQVAFTGELLVNLGHALRHPRDVRWRDALAVADAAGVNALPIISLMGFLIGLILAFQSAIPLKQFGAELYVADLVAISVVRELGPLMTAILLAGRSGSAFAAEIGTMKVNEEIDALTTMGLTPVRFLVLPRILAGIVVAPLLTLYFNLVSLVGAAVVVMSFGYPVVTYNNQVVHALTLTAVMSGLVKSFVFGVIIAGVGCQRGLTTGTGAIAVGVSTTRSVVAGILLTILVDGVFSVVYYAVGI
ncbi:MAG: MlaE family lipid ABC transporter permease subunit [Planctomycetaceae bacterium]|nr:MlaE family lipid ABC transporter permease subunit [Planctomycetaceae bacterium]